MIEMPEDVHQYHIFYDEFEGKSQEPSRSAHLETDPWLGHRH